VNDVISNVIIVSLTVSEKSIIFFTMHSSRRDFLRVTGLACTSIMFKPLNMFGIIDEAGKFLERIGISTSIRNNEILAVAGYTFVEENAREFLVPSDPDSVFAQNIARLKESKLPLEACNTFLPGNLKCVGPSPAHDEILKFAETAFRRSKQAGIKTIVLGSGGARKIPEGFSYEEATLQFITLCKKLAPVARKYDVIISLEPLNKKECNFINSLSEAGEIAKAVNDASFRLCVDIYHMLMENESPDDILKYGDLLYHAHIAEKTDRSAPGVNNENFIPYFRALKEVNYKGRLTIECNWKNLGDQASLAKSYLDKQIGSV
jgi:sugar phosphate isomerase/epimerase